MHPPKAAKEVDAVPQPFLLSLKYPQLKQGDSDDSHETRLSVSTDAPNCANARLVNSSTPSADLNSCPSDSIFFWRFIPYLKEGVFSLNSS